MAADRQYYQTVEKWFQIRFWGKKKSPFRNSNINGSSVFIFIISIVLFWKIILEFDFFIIVKCLLLQKIKLIKPSAA